MKVPSGRFLTLVCSLSLSFCTCHSLSSAGAHGVDSVCVHFHSFTRIFSSSHFTLPASPLVFLPVRNLLTSIMCLLTDISTSSLPVGSSCAVLSSVPSTWSLVLEIVGSKCVPLGWIYLFIYSLIYCFVLRQDLPMCHS